MITQGEQKPKLMSLKSRRNLNEVKSDSLAEFLLNLQLSPL